MNLNQHQAPLLETLISFTNSKRCGFHVPGHGGGRGVPEELQLLIGRSVFTVDVTELPGLDDLNQPVGAIARSQELAAQAFGANRSFFLVNGSTQGLQALILGLGHPGGKIVVPRNCHRSIIGGLILADMDPVFTSPSIVPGFNFSSGVPVREIQKAVLENPDVCAVLCVHPTYYGVVGNLRKTSEFVHTAGIPLIADEAHGSHLYFHRNYPTGALVNGADAAVQSLHKTGGSLTQSSLLHLKGRFLDENRVLSSIRLMQTSSPSYILMASLDAARRQLAVNGFDLLQETLEVSAMLRDELSEIDSIEVFGADCLDGDGIFDYDPARIVIRVSGLGLDGFRAAAWLREHYGIYVEMADPDNIVLVLGLGVVSKDCRELIRAIKELSAKEGGRLTPGVVTGMSHIPAAKIVVKLREAWFSSSRQVKLEQAAGQVAAEWVAVYPPGIPALIPGEEISSAMVNYLVWLREAGGCFQGPADARMNYLQVID